MSAPVDTPSWATGGTAVTTAPVTTRRASGFYPGERPPTQLVNYMIALIGTWVNYIYSLVGRWHWYPAAVANLVSPFTIGSVAIDDTVGGLLLTCPTDGIARFPFKLSTGNLVAGYGLAVKVSNSAAILSVNLVQHDGLGSANIIDSQSVNPLGSTGWQKITFVPVGTITGQMGSAYVLEVTVSNLTGTSQIQTVGFQIKPPS